MFLNPPLLVSTVSDACRKFVTDSPSVFAPPGFMNARASGAAVCQTSTHEQVSEARATNRHGDPVAQFVMITLFVVISLALNPIRDVA